jgi:hypothetical protein|uniref:hypothetical protein n=1 Tax=Altererythrobacter segetis TaxID=1104773 RepID=UPI00140C47EA|nr:hypothetical protein [Altererythrobacter segetis]
MTSLPLSYRRGLCGVSFAAAASLCLSPVVARAQSRANVDVSAGATAASNPYLLDGPNTSAVGVNLTVRPSLAVETGTSSVTFWGGLSLEEFFDKYGLDGSVQLGAAGEHRIDEKTTLSTNVDFRSSKSAARQFYLGTPADIVGQSQVPASSPIDPTLANVAGRSSRLSVNGSLKHLLDPKSSLVASAGVGLTRVSSGSGRDYRDSNFGLEYTRTLSETTSAVVTVNGGYANYLGQRAGDGLFVTSLVGVDHQLSQTLHFSGQIGASIAAVESPSGNRETTVAWAGNLDLCDKDGRGSACLTGTRATQPTSFGGLTTVSSVGLSYARTFGPRDTASVTAVYARTSQARLPFSTGLGRRSELVSVSGTYRRKLAERVAAFVTPSFASVNDDQSGRRQNYQALLGVSYIFGRTR